MWLHAWRVTKRAEYVFALYAGSVADPGDRNPYSGESLALAKLWMRGYTRMLRVRIETGPAMQIHRRARAAAERNSER
jgi:hypothetical protein